VYQCAFESAEEHCVPEAQSKVSGREVTRGRRRKREECEVQGWLTHKKRENHLIVSLSSASTAEHVHATVKSVNLLLLGLCGGVK